MPRPESNNALDRDALLAPTRHSVIQGKSLADEAAPAPGESDEGFTDLELKELERIESSLRFLKLTRPRTDEYLDQKAQETTVMRRIREAVIRAITISVEIQKIIERLDEMDRRRFLVRRIEAYVDEESAQLKPPPTKPTKRLIVQDIIDEILGLGPLEQLVKDDAVSEIMVNGPSQVYAERHGRVELTPIRFDGETHLRKVIDRIVSPIGRRIDESSPLVDARLADGSRVNAIIPPIALDGSSLTIRKFARVALTIADLIERGALTREMALFLDACVKARLNVVISGGTGSGKTTLLNILADFIPPGDRIVTIEDAAELQVKHNHEHVVRLESRPANIEGRGSLSIRDLVRNSLRMRPDRIIVGECRSGEALDMLQAMNTGHDGSMTTGHANTPRDMVRRLETMVKMSGVDIPILAIREQIAAAVHIIVQASRLTGGSRKVTSITEVTGMSEEGDRVAMEEIFAFEQTGIDEEGMVVGAHRPTGILPRFLKKFQGEGIELDARIFKRPPAAT